MKRIIALLLAFALALPCIGCGKKPGIPVNALSWVWEGQALDGHNYMVFQMTNSSNVAIESVTMTYQLIEATTQEQKEQKEQFLKALQESQGFTDAFMQDYLQKLKENGNQIKLIASIYTALEPGETSDLQQCYYMGGWTSRDLIYVDLFTPVSLYLTYEKNGKTYGQTYDFRSEKYTVAPVEAQQQ